MSRSGEFYPRDCALGHGYIESFNTGIPGDRSSSLGWNGEPRDECLNVEVFFNLADARRKLFHWRRDYNHQRPHSALDDRTPAEFAAICSRGRDGDETALEDATRLPLFHRTATTRILSQNNSLCKVLLEALT